MDIARLIRDREGPIFSCSASTSVMEAGQLLTEKRIGALPVLDDGHVVGIFSERDFLYCVSDKGAAALELTVGDVMTPAVNTIGLDTDATEALRLMTRRRVRHLPIMESGRMIGFVSIGDLVKLRVEAAEAEADAMRAYIQTA